MTICIAAACCDGDKRKIIVCSDMMMSGPLGNAQTAMKVRTLGPGWLVAVSGGEDINPTVALLKEEFGKAHVRAMNSDYRVDDATSVPLVRTALMRRKNEKADEIIQGRYGISWSQFLETGKDRLPPEIYREEVAHIRDMRFDAEFIIAGFWEKQFPFLLETDSNGRTAIREDFAVVGSGGYLAQSVLLQRQHSDVNSFEESLYAVWEAKKAAENERAVGEHTNFLILDEDGTRSRLSMAGRAWLDQKYRELSPRPLPTKWDFSPDWIEKNDVQHEEP